MPKKIEPAVRERVMRMIAEHRSEYATPTELARVLAARERLGVETVRRWIVQAEVDGGIRPGVSSSEHVEIVIPLHPSPRGPRSFTGTVCTSHHRLLRNRGRLIGLGQPTASVIGTTGHRRVSSCLYPRPVGQHLSDNRGRLIDRHPSRLQCAERRRMKQTGRRLREQIIIVASLGPLM
jgi:hypothetical protein